jgi:hypothetical protein
VGRQIGIVQSSSDEADLIDMLNRRYSLLALPFSRSDTNFMPVRFGECRNRDQIIFLEGTIRNISRYVIKHPRSSRRYLIRRSLTSGRCIEWNRTRHVGNKEVEGGRYYVDTWLRGPVEDLMVMKRIMTLIQRHIRQHYPMRSIDRYPIYIGPSMWDLVKEGKRKVVYGKGAEMKLVENK